MSIFKIKLQIFLVGFIIYQVGLLMHKQDNGYTMPTLQPAAVQAKQNGFASPAYASDNGGRELNIPYDPYMGSSTSDRGQMEAAARAHAQSMMQSGDTSSFKDALMNDPHAAELFGLK